MTELCCVLPHRRVNADGDVVWDHEEPRLGAHKGEMYLCTGHLARFREVIASTPKAVSWMREQLEPVRGESDGARASKPGSKLPLSAAAVDAADETLGLLCSWAGDAAEQLGQTPPPMGSTWQVLKSAHTTDGETRVQGFRPDDFSAVNQVTRWLLERVDDIARHDWVEDFTTELCDQRATNLARWPYEERPKPVPRIECPTCERCALVVYTPASAPVYSTELLLVDGKPVPVVDSSRMSEPVRDVDGNVVVRSTVVRRQLRYSDGTPVYATVQKLQSAPPLLVQCRHCGATIPESEWDVLVAADRERKRVRA